MQPPRSPRKLGTAGGVGCVSGSDGGRLNAANASTTTRAHAGEPPSIMLPLAAKV